MAKQNSPNRISVTSGYYWGFSLSRYSSRDKRPNPVIQIPFNIMGLYPYPVISKNGKAYNSMIYIYIIFFPLGSGVAHTVLADIIS